MNRFILSKLILSMVCLLILILSLFGCAEDESKNSTESSSIDFSKFPFMHCQVVFAYGKFFGYQPPRSGDSLSMNLRRMSQLKKLQFDTGKGSYIPLFDPLEIEKVTLISETEMIDLRLLSKHKKRHRVFLDIQHYDTSRSIDSKVWIIEEDKVVRSVALMECKFSAKMV